MLVHLVLKFLIKRLNRLVNGQKSLVKCNCPLLLNIFLA